MRLLILITAIAIVIALLVLNSNDEAAESQSLPEILSDEPDVYLKNARVQQFETTGDLQYELVAAEIRHFDRDALTRMLDPDLTLFSPDEPPWQISSRRGRIVETDTAQSTTGERSEQVELTDDVRLQQQHADGNFIDLRSEALTILPRQRIARTDLDVMIDTNVGRTKAVGMNSNLTTGIIRLGSSEHQRVHTIVLPEQLR